MTLHLGNGNVPSALNWNRHCGVQGLLHLLHLNLYILVKFVLVIAFETGAALQTYSACTKREAFDVDSRVNPELKSLSAVTTSLKTYKSKRTQGEMSETRAIRYAASTPSGVLHLGCRRLDSETGQRCPMRSLWLLRFAMRVLASRSRKPQDTRLRSGAFQNASLRYSIGRPGACETRSGVYLARRGAAGVGRYSYCTVHSTVLPVHLRCRAWPPVSEGAELSR